jgi:hypothetical protein
MQGDGWLARHEWPGGGTSSPRLDARLTIRTRPPSNG